MDIKSALEKRKVFRNKAAALPEKSPIRFIFELHLKNSIFIIITIHEILLENTQDDKQQLFRLLCNFFK